MIYFRLKRPAQLALIGVALTAPGCYLSHGEDDADTHADDVHVVDDVPDAMDVRDVRDARDDGDFHVDPPVDAWDVPDTTDVEPDFVVDMVPVPACADVEAGALLASGVEAGDTYAIGQVRLDAPAIDPYASIECSSWPCVDVVPFSGVGRVTDIERIDSTTVRFIYNNPSLGWDEMIRLDITWNVSCSTSDGTWTERTLEGTAWACRDEAFRVRITGAVGECPTIDDPVPSPMVRSEPRPGSPGSETLALHAAPQPGGAYRLQARGPDGTRSYRWLASGGKLRMLSDAEAIFEPAPGAGLCMVQVAAFTRGGVSIQVFRKRRG